MLLFLSHSKKQLKLFALLILWLVQFSAHALFVSEPRDPLPLINEIFPQATKVSDKVGDPLIWTIYKQNEIIGYAFETNDLARIPAYSGEPVNMLVAMDPKGCLPGG